MLYLAPFMVPPKLSPQRRAVITRFFAAIQRGDHDELIKILTADAVTRWPQSGERITGAMSCVRVYENYPGGPPKFRVSRVIGDGDVWVAELIAEYDGERWFALSVVEFKGLRIARMTDYFGTAFRAPEWRRDMVEMESVPA